MPRRLLKVIAGRLSGGSRSPSATESRYAFSTVDIVWVIGSFFALNRKPFDAGRRVRQFPPPCSTDSLIHAVRALGFQMSASHVSQPMLRLVGLWQQIQSVQHLGDIMNAPQEPFALQPSRTREGKRRIEIAELAFRYADNLPFRYQDFQLTVEPGKVVTIARALLKRPKILVFEEATSALDPTTAEHFTKTIHQFKGSNNHGNTDCR